MNARLTDMLRREGAQFEILRHPRVFTAQERAAACHISGRVLAKVVVVRDDADGWFALAVLPASGYLDIVSLRALTGRPRLHLASEADFGRLFPDCDIGAMPPFGQLYGGLDVFVDLDLAGQRELVCEAGAHDEELRMPMSEYLRIEEPYVAGFTAERKAA